MNSYLLVLDGSAESHAAAHLAWDLAEHNNARVIAQYIIDVPAVWRLLSFKSPGFIGSGVFVEAAERIKESLHSIAEALMLSYSAQADGRNLEYETYIDEGDPVTEIIRRAQEHDMLIVGHNRSDADSQEPLGYSLCEKLAQNCSISMLIVNEALDNWTKVSVRAADRGETEANASTTFSEFARALGLPADLKAEAAAQSKDELLSYIRQSAQPALLLWHQPTPRHMLAC